MELDSECVGLDSRHARYLTRQHDRVWQLTDILEWRRELDHSQIVTERTEKCNRHVPTSRAATTIEGMQTEAQKRNLTFVESQAHWLIELAIKLATENREPNKIESIRLRAVRIGNWVLNG